jgi:hypothetical protein
MLGLFRTPLSKALVLAGLGFELAPLLFFLSVVVPPEIGLPTFLASAIVSSSLVWLSFFYFTGHSFPRWRREQRVLAALGLYFFIGVPLSFFVSWVRSLEGIQFNFWVSAEFGALVLFAWPFMVPFMIVFTPN